MKEELIKKVRQHCADNNIDGLLLAQVNTYIAMFESDQITIDLFKITISILLQIIL